VQTVKRGAENDEKKHLLVLSEQGELAIVKAAPEQFAELARFPAIEGKTWNQPVLVGDANNPQNSLAKLPKSFIFSHLDKPRCE
jgi:hypothetical protein